MGPAADQAYAVLVLCPIGIEFVIFPEGAQIHIEDRRLDIILKALLGNNGLFQGYHTAGAGTITCRTLLQAPGTDALDPGDLFRLFAV